MKKINHYIENNNTFAIIFIATVLVGGYFLFTLSPQSSARHTYEPNDDIVRVAEDDPSNALYINNNPRFEVLLGDKENPNKPTVTYISHTSSIPHSLSFTLADSGGKATAPSLETVVSGNGDKKPRLIYRSALDNADINYRIDKGRGVKEEIILKVAPADNGGRDVGFVFDAEFSEGVQVEQGKDGVWYFTDSGGNYLFNFERPFMVDADGVRSDDVAIDIVPVEGGGLSSAERSGAEVSPRPYITATQKRSFLAEQIQITKNTEGNPSASFVRRQVESNHIPLKNGISRLSSDGQNHLTSTSSNLRSFNYTNAKTKSNISNTKDIASSFVARSKPPLDNHYTQYTQLQNSVKEFVYNILMERSGAEGGATLRRSLRREKVVPRVAYKEQTQTYQIILKANGLWLHDEARAYPVMIDPSVTHNADSDFTGEFNRVVDADATSSTQLEIGYQEHGLDPYTVLLIHGNEANGSTVITDMASSTRVITANGHASTTSAVTQLGLNNSMAFDGAGDYFSIPDSADWDFTTGDFSIEAWVKLNTLNQYHGIVVQADGGSANSSWGLDILSDNTVRGYTFNSANTIKSVISTTLMNTGVWHHLAVTREGNNLKIWFDGVNESTTAMGSYTVRSASLAVNIGRQLGVDDTDGNIDELRITKGRALTTEEIKAAASRRPYAVYTSQVIDSTKTGTEWDTLSWTEGGVNTGDGETLYDDTSLVAQWNFNETSGTSASDSSANSHTGTLTNMTTSGQDAAAGDGWTAENRRWGAGALMFDGSDAYVSVTDDADWNFNTGNFTIETWINPDTLGDDIQQHFVGQWEDVNNKWWFGWEDSGKLWVYFLDDSSVKASYKTTSAWNPPLNAWYHLAVVRNGTSLKLYINGVDEPLTITTAISTNDVGDMSSALLIGQNATANYFDGTMDSMRIYKGRALSQAEILSNYNVGNIEIQTRSGATSDPNDGTWEAWKPVTSETQILSADTDRGNWIPFRATGGTVTYADGYTIHSFTTDGQTFTPNGKGTVEYLVVGGGGGGGSTGGGGGGGGGHRSDTGFLVTAQAYSITVGAGGSSTYPASAGGDSIFSSITSDGGGAGGEFQSNGGSGGSGGGAGGRQITTGTGGTATAGQGSDGGDNSVTGAGGGGGGGGAGAVGSNTATTNGANGGAGVSNSITGSAVTRAGGGGGGMDSSPTALGGTGGAGGGGNGDGDGSSATAGTANTGGGGGGGGNPHDAASGDGGSGIVIIRYPTAYVQLSDESNIKMEGSGSMKLEIGKPQIDGNTVAMWHFDETNGDNAGDDLFDETVNNNDGEFVGSNIATAVVDGIIGKAREFNGTDDYVEVPIDTDFAFGSSDFTIEAWVKYTTATDNLYPVALWDNTGNERIWALITGSSGKMRFVGSSDGTSTDISISGTITTNDGVWHHVVGVRSGNNQYLYIDGVKDGVDDNFSGSLLANSTDPVRIGASSAATATGLFTGNIDEVRIQKGYGMSADEVAEAYRLGANHKISRDITVQDFSASTTMPFWVAGDELGTYLEATIGESAWANYDSATTSTSTVLFIHGDEITDSTSIKDSSISSHTITANGNAKITASGKIGNAMTFDGTTDYFTIGDTSDFKFLHGAEDTTAFKWTFDAWVRAANFDATQMIFASYSGGSSEQGVSIEIGSSRQIWMAATRGVASSYVFNSGFSTYFPNDDDWHHIAITYDQSLASANSELFIDGTLVDTIDKTGNAPSTSDSTEVLTVGARARTGDNSFTGDIDEVRIIKDTVMTQAEIRQAYEYGARSHSITIDFKASLQPSDLIADSSDTQFAITATTTGLSATTTGLYIGDKIIVKENVSGTEYLAQGTATTTNTTTGVVNVDQWDTGSTFPSGGYTQYATVFKWQKEYMPLGGILDSHIDAVQRITLRPTNGAGGRTVYLDDFRGSSGFLTASSSEAITSGDNRYFQYRTIYTTADTAVSPYLTAITVNYTLSANSTPSVIGISGGGFLSF